MDWSTTHEEYKQTTISLELSNKKVCLTNYNSTLVDEWSLDQINMPHESMHRSLSDMHIMRIESIYTMKNTRYN